MNYVWSVAEKRLILMQPDGNEAKVVMQQTADDVDQAKRSSPPNLLPVLTREPHPHSQRVECVRIFASGFPHRTHPPTITSPVALISKEQQHGSFKTAPSANGSLQVRFFGFTECVRSSVSTNVTPDGPLSASWLREERTLVRRFSNIFVQKH